MKVTPLFKNREEPICPSDERIILFLDEAEENEEKRAFLNHCSLCERCMRRWNYLCGLEDMGKRFPQPIPDPGIRARVLEAAYADPMRYSPARMERNRKPFSFQQLPGWRLAWAALFLVFGWGAYLQFEKKPIHSPHNIEYSVDEELLTLEYELEQMRLEIDLTLTL
ncbi:MAG: hypothetical protein C4527_12770 [Candidatus Omnitrophota bacterium]|jgi:hypothetical protein|nr:MAG: hypothetical protein C4527_12770 [Candidatus Omnitrophota bacterium]